MTYLIGLLRRFSELCTQDRWTQYVGHGRCSILPVYYFFYYFIIILFYFIFWLHRVACGISVSWPGIEPGPWQWKCGILTTRQPGNSHCLLLLQVLNSKGLPVFVPGMENISLAISQKECPRNVQLSWQRRILFMGQQTSSRGPRPELDRLAHPSRTSSLALPAKSSVIPTHPVHFCHACYPFQDDLCASPAPSVDCLLPGGRMCSTHFWISVLSNINAPRNAQQVSTFPVGEANPMRALPGNQGRNLSLYRLLPPPS